VETAATGLAGCGYLFVTHEARTLNFDLNFDLSCALSRKHMRTQSEMCMRINLGQALAIGVCACADGEAGVRPETHQNERCAAT